MSRRTVLLALILVLATPLGGCWSRRELQDTAFVLSLGLEEAGNGKIRLTVQSALPSQLSSGGAGEGGGGGGSGATGPVWVATADGPTAFAGLRELEKRSSDQLFLAHARALIIQEKVAKAGLQPVLDFLTREPQIRESIQLLITADSATDAVKVISPQEKIPIFYLTNLLEHARRDGASRGLDLQEYLVESSISGTAVAMPRLAIVQPEQKPGEGGGGGGKPAGGGGGGGGGEKGGEPPKPTEYLISGMAVVRNHRFQGYLPPAAVPGLLWLSDEVQGLPLTVDHPTDPRAKIAAEVFQGGVKREVIPDEQNPERTVIRLKAYGEANIREVASYSGRRAAVPDVRTVNRAISREVAHQIWRSLSQARRYQADIYGLAEQAREVIPADRWRAFARQWPRAFAQCKIEVTADIRLRRRGMTF